MADKIDRAALAQTIRELEGIDNDTRAALLELVNRKKYGLVWEEHPEDVEERLREQLPVLEEDRALALTDGGKEAPNHILIEGDNLEALTALTYTHEGKIDVIYIDPPYNTGNKDFIYNDSYVDSEDGYRHSKWLSFMSKRLRIAKRLLSDSGILLISIDYYSFAQLKLLCDGIFENSVNPDNWNYIECLIWDKQHSQQQGVFKRYHEYVLVYSKSRHNVSNVLTKGEGIIEAGAMKKISVKNPASEFMFPAGVKFEAPNGTTLEGVYGDSEKVYVVKGKLVAENGKTKYPVTLKAGWTQKKQMESWFSGNETFDTKGQKVIEFYFNSTGKIKCRKARGVITPSSILPNFGMGSEQTAYLEEILGESGQFTNPKPVEMIKLFEDWFCPTQGIVLDFFAGSGTTLHATMQLNKEDGGHRQCILVQGIERDVKTKMDKQIARKVTYERNKRVIQGYTTPKGAEVEGLDENNLRYYRTKLLPRDTGLTAQRRLMEAATELLCIKHDVYEECTMLGGLRLKPKLCRYFAEEGRAGMLIVYRTEAIGRLVEEIKTLPEGGELLVYVFSLSSYAMDADFEEVADRVTLCALPRAIYNAYQKVLPKKGRRQELPPLATSDENTQLTIEEGGEA